MKKSVVSLFLIATLSTATEVFKFDCITQKTDTIIETIKIEKEIEKLVKNKEYDGYIFRFLMWKLNAYNKALKEFDCIQQ